MVGWLGGGDAWRQRPRSHRRDVPAKHTFRVAGSAGDEPRGCLGDGTAAVRGSEHRGVKRLQLLAHLRAHGCVLIREGAKHSWWGNLVNNRRSAVPRHREVGNLMAK